MALSDPLVLASCLRCQDEVWVCPGSHMADGQPLSFDLVGQGPDRMLLVHSCLYDPHPGFEEDDPFEDWDPDDLP